MSTHTDEARRAAEKIAFRIWPKVGGYTKKDSLISQKVVEFATIIDQETGLPAITAERDMLKRQLEVNAIVEDDVVTERDRLREACTKMQEFLLEWRHAIVPYHLTGEDFDRLSGISWAFKAALAKEPESGEEKRKDKE